MLHRNTPHLFPSKPPLLHLLSLPLSLYLILPYLTFRTFARFLSGSETTSMATPQFSSKSPTIRRIRKLNPLGLHTHPRFPAHCLSRPVGSTSMPGAYMDLQFAKPQSYPAAPPRITPLNPSSRTFLNGILLYEARPIPSTAKVFTTAASSCPRPILFGHRAFASPPPTVVSKPIARYV
jgi:hypothetical protein